MIISTHCEAIKDRKARNLSFALLI